MNDVEKIYECIIVEIQKYITHANSISNKKNSKLLFVGIYIHMYWCSVRNKIFITRLEWPFLKPTMSRIVLKLHKHLPINWQQIYTTKLFKNEKEQWIFLLLTYLCVPNFKYKAQTFNQLAIPINSQITQHRTLAFKC